MQAVKKDKLTFAVISFNNEEFINEAIDGAFSQTHENLTIVLSDDKSEDRTFEKIQDRANKYNGPHKIIVRQNKKNLGVVNHIETLARIAESDYIILSAGDDISKPERSSIIHNKINPPIFDIICSNIDFIDEAGKLLQKNTHTPVEYMKKYLKYFDNNFLVAPSAVYKISFLSNAIESIKKTRFIYKLNTEDFLFWLFLAGIDGKILRISEVALVKYRLNSRSLSAVKKKNNSFREEKLWILKESAMLKINFEKQMAATEMIASPKFQVSRVNMDAIKKSSENSKRMYLMVSRNFSDRFLALLRSRSLSEFKNSALRVFGVNAAALLRFFINK